MLKTWRDLVASEEILPRLCDALQKIRRHDLAVKMGLELGVYGELLRRKKIFIPDFWQRRRHKALDLIRPTFSPLNCQAIL